MPDVQSSRLHLFKERALSADGCHLLWVGDSNSVFSNDERPIFGHIEHFPGTWESLWAAQNSQATNAGSRRQSPAPDSTAGEGATIVGAVTNPYAVGVALQTRTSWANGNQAHRHLMTLVGSYADGFGRNTVGCRYHCVKLADADQLTTFRFTALRNTGSTEVEGSPGLEGSNLTDLDDGTYVKYEAVADDDGGGTDTQITFALEAGGSQSNRSVAIVGGPQFFAPDVTGMNMMALAVGGRKLREQLDVVNDSEPSGAYTDAGLVKVLQDIFPVDTAVLSTGHNDGSDYNAFASDSDYDDWQTDVEKWVTRWRRVWAAAGITNGIMLLCGMWRDTNTNTVYQNMGERLRAVSLANEDVAFVSHDTLMNAEHGAPSSWVGTYLDGVHPNTAGMDEIPRVFWNAVIAARAGGGRISRVPERVPRRIAPRI